MNKNMNTKQNKILVVCVGLLFSILVAMITNIQTEKIVENKYEVTITSKDAEIKKLKKQIDNLENFNYKLSLKEEVYKNEVKTLSEKSTEYEFKMKKAVGELNELKKNK